MRDRLIELLKGKRRGNDDANRNVQKACELMEKYAKCPKCGCEVVGNGKGTLEIDKGLFKRTCHCGWSVVINEKKGGAE